MGVWKGFIWVLILGICTLCSCNSDTSSVTDWIGAVASVLGLVLSGIAIYFAYKAFNQAEITARNSLRPLLVYEQLDFTIKNGGAIEKSLINKGVGPAIILKIHYFYEEEKLDDGTYLPNFIISKFEELGFENHNEFTLEVYGKGIDINGVIKDGEQLDILTIRRKGDNKDTYDLDVAIKRNWISVNSILNKLRFVLIYSSIYGDETIMNFGNLPD